MARNRAWPGGFEPSDLPPDTRRITSVHLRGYQLGGDDPSSSKTRRNSSLTSLLSRAPLSFIDLKNAHLDDSAIAALAAGLPPTLVSLHLHRSGNHCSLSRSCRCGVSGAGAAVLVDALIAAGGLRELNIGHHLLGDAGGVALGDALGPARLHTLDLKDNGLGP